MKDKKKLILLGGLLFVGFLAVIGGSYAFFSVIFNDTRNEESNGNTNVSTGNISNATIVSNIPNGIGSFLSTDIYPGHKEILGLSVTSSGEVNSKSYFQFKYKVSENGLENVKISVYESDTPIEITENHFNCKKKNEKIENSNDTKYFEVCEGKNIGKLLQETTLTGGNEEVIIGKDFITIKEENVDITKYYYVVVEFINKEESQNEDMNRSLVGNVIVELTSPFEIPKSISEQNMDYILSKKIEGQIVEDDGTVDHNLRYIGSNPNNYVSFNNELWRIIGFMNNIDNGIGNKETRIKLLRNESIGEFSFDTSDSEINYGWGFNNWSESDLMKLLNPGFETESVGGSLYWNRGTGTCYNDSSNATTQCEFTNTGLKDDAKKGIEKAVWHLGDSTETNNAFQLYNEERGENSSNIQNYWVGMVGLLYPSDFYLSTSGEGTELRENCLKNWLGDDQLVKEKCYKNSWIYKGSQDRVLGDQWAITPAKNYPHDSYYISNMAFPGSGGAWDAIPFGIYPSVYLKSNIKIIRGDGSSGNPFKLNIDEI